MIVLYDPKTGFITQSSSAVNVEELKASIKKSGRPFIEVSNEAFFFDGVKQPIFRLKIKDGKIVLKTDEDMQPSSSQISAMELGQVDTERRQSAPSTIHAMKLNFALNNHDEALQAEADSKGIPVQKLKTIIIEKAQASVLSDVRNSAKQKSILANLKN